MPTRKIASGSCIAHGGVLTGLELQFRRKDGRQVPVLVRVHEAGEIFIEGQFVDLSDSRGAEEARQQVRQRAA